MPYHRLVTVHIFRPSPGYRGHGSLLGYSFLQRLEVFTGTQYSRCYCLRSAEGRSSHIVAVSVLKRRVQLALLKFQRGNIVVCVYSTRPGW